MNTRNTAVAMIFPSAALDDETIVRALAMDAQMTETQARSGQMLSKEHVAHINPMKDQPGLTFLSGVSVSEGARLPNFEAALIEADMAFDTRAYMPDLGISNTRWRPGMGERAQDVAPNLGADDPDSMIGHARERAPQRAEDESSMSMG